jgi:hypothetical protein
LTTMKGIKARYEWRPSDRISTLLHCSSSFRDKKRRILYIRDKRYVRIREQRAVDMLSLSVVLFFFRQSGFLIIKAKDCAPKFAIKRPAAPGPPTDVCWSTLVAQIRYNAQPSFKDRGKAPPMSTRPTLIIFVYFNVYQTFKKRQL